MCEVREIFLYNWYFSLRHAEFILSRNTYATGKIQVNRGAPKHLIDTKQLVYLACFIRKNYVLEVKYKDKRGVYMLTTNLTTDFVEKIDITKALLRNIIENTSAFNISMKILLQSMQ